jgi:hypothetical protein
MMFLKRQWLWIGLETAGALTLVGGLLVADIRVPEKKR